MTVLEVITVIGSWLAPCWEFFELPFPLFGIRIVDIYIGLALAAIGIRVIKRAIDSPEGEPLSDANRLHQSELRRSGNWFKK